MQVIELRAWNPLMEMMINDISLKGLADLGTHKTEGSEVALILQYDWEHLIWMQFIGLTDKAGNKIFDGDILQSTIDKRLFNWLVEFKGGCFVIVNIGIDGYLGERYKVDSTTFIDRIKIGNKYQDPELLLNKV